jgi:aryl-alcohol dehydrogenase-like predicted oxidoreductase
LVYGINNPDKQKTSTKEVGAILKQAYEVDISMLDTSYAYGDSETIIGRSISNTDFRFKIISKYPENVGKVKDVFNRSLKRLKTDHIYGYMVHHFDYFKSNTHIWNDFRALKESSKVEKIGFSVYNTSDLSYLLDNDIQFDIIQFPYNIFDRQFAPYFAELKSRGVEIHVRSTFLQGLFFKERESLPEYLKPLKKYLLILDNFAKEENLTIEEVALNYNIQNPYIDGVLIGVDNVKQLQKNINAVQKNTTIDIQIDVKEKELLNPVNWK